MKTACHREAELAHARRRAAGECQTDARRQESREVGHIVHCHHNCEACRGLVTADDWYCSQEEGRRPQEGVHDNWLGFMLRLAKLVALGQRLLLAS
jgi:hypothetical protein